MIMSSLADFSTVVDKSVSVHVYRKYNRSLRKTIAEAAERQGWDAGSDGRPSPRAIACHAMASSRMPLRLPQLALRRAGSARDHPLPHSTSKTLCGPRRRPIFQCDEHWTSCVAPPQAATDTSSTRRHARRLCRQAQPDLLVAQLRS